MSMMLDVAGGVVIGGGVLSLFRTGWHTDSAPFGLAQLFVAAIATFWLLFVQTGVMEPVFSHLSAIMFPPVTPR
jgi:hypothetical protein